MYNNIFLHFWDTVMAPTLCNICLWMTVTSKKSLDRQFELEFERYVLISFILSKLVAALLICNHPSPALPDRPGGKKMPFLSEKTLYIVDIML
jgi:hypothetical protein